MSHWQASHEFINVSNTALGDHQYPPKSAQNQASAQGVSDFIDGSGPIFAMYLERAKEEDEKMAESWKDEAGQVFLFTGLFAAVVASLITTSIQDIQLNPQDTSNFYLANIQQALTDPNPSNISLPSSPPPFHPPSSAIWVNSLWVLSLVINLTCAILANLLQQWARRYLEVTQTRYSLHKRARIRAFYAEGVQKFLLPWVFEALPAMLHLSVFFFFAGLIVFLWNFDPTISKLVLSWVGICTALYGCTTIIPIFRHDSPYYTPFTPLARLVAVVILHVSLILRNCFIFLLCTCTCYGSCCYPILRCLSWDRRRGSITQILDSTLMTAEEAALMTSSEIDARAFMWTFDRLEEDHELERFFTGLPGFRSSKVIEDPLPILSNWEKQKISESLIGFLDLTFSSTFLPEAVKSQRAIIAAKALDLAEFPQGSGNRLRDTIFRACYRGPRTANYSPLLGDIKDENTIFVQAIFTAIVARQQQRDDSWFRQVAPNALGIPEAVLRDYDGSGHSLSLAMLIHITRQQLTYFQHPTWPTYEFAAVLEEASKFNVQDTSPELQHEFCALWNEIVLKARTGDRRIAGSILRYIRGIYIILHRSTDSAPSRFAASTKKFDGILENPFSYPLCNVPNHALNDSTTTSIAQTVPHENAPLVPASLGSPDTPSSAIPAPFQVDKRPTDVPPHDNSHNSHITDPTAGTVRIPLTSPDRAHAGAVRNTDSSGITMPRSTPETPTSAPPRSSTFPPTAFPLQHHANTLSLSNQPNPSFMASNLVLDNTLSTGSHRLKTVTSSPGASPGMASAPYPGAAAVVGDDRPKHGPRKEMDALEPPSVNRAGYTGTMATPQSPSQRSATDSDVAIACRSPREQNVGSAGAHPPHREYDVV